MKKAFNALCNFFVSAPPDLSPLRKQIMERVNREIITRTRVHHKGGKHFAPIRSSDYPANIVKTVHLVKAELQDCKTERELKEYSVMIIKTLDKM